MMQVVPLLEQAWTTPTQGSIVSNFYKFHSVVSDEILFLCSDIEADV